jgi:hypothetical protein
MNAQWWQLVGMAGADRSCETCRKRSGQNRLTHRGEVALQFLVVDRWARMAREGMGLHVSSRYGLSVLKRVGIQY